MTERVAIIGAGPAGVTAAYQLAKAGAMVDLYEAGASVGGMAKTIALWGQKVDIGPHRFFSSDRRVNQLWLEVAGQDYTMVDRLTRIYYKGKFFHYPLKPFDALQNLGIGQAALAMASYGKEKIARTPQDGTLENWVVSRFGRRLYEIFFKTYTEKLWGISCRELDADWAAQRIKKLSLYEAIKNAVLGGAGNKHKTLVDQFAYPTEGTGMIYERMAEKIRALGGRVHLKTPIARVAVKDGRATGVELEDGTFQAADAVVSSMPLTQLIARLDDAPADIKARAERLRFRNTILVYLQVDDSALFPDNWLYIHSANVRAGRLTNFRNWAPGLYGKEKSTILAFEYWCFDDDALWAQDEASLIAMAKADLVATGLSKGAAILAGKAHKISKCYPVYQTGYRQDLEPVEKYLSSIGAFHAIGRYGAFKYNNQDHSILMGILAAENIVHGTHHNLWEINTDYESYQEEAVITKTGLSVKAA